MIIDLPPGLVLICGAAPVPLLRGRLKQAWLLLLPLVAAGVVHTAPEGAHWTFSFLGYDLVLGRVDRLARVFGYIFSLIAFIGFLFSLHVKDDLQQMGALVYAGSALGVTFAGDFLSLYVYWEFMAVASTFLILARRTPAARAAALRYILVHLAGGLVLLAGILIRLFETSRLEVDYIGLGGPGSWLIFLGIAVNAAIPPLHPWLKDAYPEGTPTGSVFLSAFTTKSAVYLMARTYPGAEVLIWLGAIMTFLPIFYAVLENDIRGVLSYSLINQVGFMMCGIGIGTALSLNGTVSHAFCHILYKALLFMAAGSVLHVTGRIRCTDLGGLYKTMPLTCLFCIVGAASISAFPLFSGFVSKSMIVSAAGHHHMIVIWLMLQFASAGVFHHAGIKVPFFMFFGHDAHIRAKDPPWNMLLAMGTAAFFCIFLGVYPHPLYAILPFPVEYVPYTGAHVVGQLQLLMFGALAFTLLMMSGMYPPEIRAVNLDTDWFYRRGGAAVTRWADQALNRLNAASERLFVDRGASGLARASTDAPARVVVMLLSAFWRITGIRGEELAARKTAVARHVREGMLPAGLGALLAGVILILAFLLA
jgi:multicomponent Na+:H+ antiporter subunit D